MYSAIGVFKITFDLDHDEIRDTVYNTKGQKNWFYIVYYLLSWVQNVVFVLILFFNSTKSYLMISFIVLSFPIAVLFQIFYEMIERKQSSSQCCNCLANWCKDSEEKMKLNELLFKYEIYISGKSDSKEINESINSLDQNYNLTCYNSSEGTFNNEENLVLMLGAKLFISVYGECSDNIDSNRVGMNKEIATARRLKMPILFIYASEEQKRDDKRKYKNNETRTVFTELENSLKDKYGLIGNIKKNGHPYKSIKSIEYPIKNFYQSSNLVGTICSLKSENKLIFLRENPTNACSLYTQDILNDEMVRIITGLDSSVKICVNNRAKEIILYDFFSLRFNIHSFKVNSDMVLVSNCFKSGDVAVDVTEIEVNEITSHIYGMKLNKLFHFNENFKLIEALIIDSMLRFRVFKDELFVLYRKIEMEDYHYISLYREKNNKLKLKKTLAVDYSVIIDTGCFEITEKYILLMGKFRNKFNISTDGFYLFLIDRNGILLQKTRLDAFVSDLIFNFVVVDDETIYFQINLRLLVKIKFNNGIYSQVNSIEKAGIEEESGVGYFQIETFNNEDVRRNTGLNGQSEVERTPLIGENLAE